MEAEAPFTDSFELDIELLSSYLDGQQPLYFDSILRQKDNASLKLMSNISTLLAVGNEHVNAVVGSIDQQGVNCLVFTENARPDRERTAEINTEAQQIKNAESSAAGNPQQTGEQRKQKAAGSNKNKKEVEENSRDPQLVPITPKPEKGEEVLSAWATAEDNVDLDAHIQDLFNIISFLQLPGVEHHDHFRLFEHFIHRRAFRRLGWRVLELSQNWGNKPFRLLDHAVISKPEPFRIALTRVLHVELFQHYISPLSEQEASVNELSVVCTYTVNSENLKDWLDLLQDIWSILEKTLIVETGIEGEAERAVTKGAPDVQTTETIVVTMFCLVEVRQVLKFLVSLPGVEKILEFAEYAAQIKKDLRVQSKRRFAAQEAGTVEAVHDQDQPDNEDSLKPPGETSGDRFLRFFDTVIAWYTSAHHVYNRTQKSLSNRHLKLHQLRYPSLELDRFKVDKVLQFLQRCSGDMGSCTQLDAANLVSKALNGKVHAEAALMSFVCNRHEFELAGNKEVPVGVSKKCCRLCWLLKELLNEDNPERKFILPGTHGTFYPWIPPPGLPVQILTQLRKALLQEFYDITTSRSGHSSGSVQI